MRRVVLAAVVEDDFDSEKFGDLWHGGFFNFCGVKGQMGEIEAAREGAEARRGEALRAEDGERMTEGEKGERGADGDVGVPEGGADDGRFFSHGGTGSTAGGGENRFDFRDGGDWELRGCVGSLSWVCVDDGT